MNFLSLEADGVPVAGPKLIELERNQDSRGFFARSYCENEFASADLPTLWVQSNVSFTAKKGSLRGMHFQTKAAAEAKLVQCVKGAVFDVIVDLRKDSSTFGKYVSAKLTEDNLDILYIPGGFAHGFQTLSNDVLVTYRHTKFYTPLQEGGFHYADPTVAIVWPEAITEMSERDKNFGPFLELEERSK